MFTLFPDKCFNVKECAIRNYSSGGYGVRSKQVVGLAGMPGAGKSVVVSVSRASGYGVVVMGDEMREEANRRSLKPSRENLERIMLELRRDEGDAVIAKKCVPKIERSAEPKVIVDGVRSLSEAEEFSKRFSRFNLMAVHSSPETRFKRLYHRRRSDDPESWEAFRERDLMELCVGLGNVIAMAEYVIVNEEKIEDMKRKAREVLGRVEERWMR
jgi:dephospho-CoA kinase